MAYLQPLSSMTHRSLKKAHSAGLNCKGVLLTCGLCHPAVQHFIDFANMQTCMPAS